MYNTISPKSKRWGKEMIFVVNCFMEIYAVGKPVLSFFKWCHDVVKMRLWAE